MEQLALSPLRENGYSEDKASKRAFERRYLPFVVMGVVLCLAPVPLARFIWTPFHDTNSDFGFIIVCFLLGWALCTGAACHAARAIPRSRESGLPMKRFLRSDAAPDVVEYIYVDQQSRTYFTHVVQSFT